MKQFCSHHPTQAAHFQCPKCSSLFCRECIVKRERGSLYKDEVLHLCPKCMIPAEWIGAANLIDPFWTRLPRFFAYPLSLRPFSLIFGVSLAGSIFSSPGLITMIIQIVIWAILLKYAYASLKTTAKGDLVPPRLNSQTLTEDFSLVFKQIWIFVVVFAGFIFVQKSAGVLFSALYLIVAVLSIPAMIIIFVTTESLLNAVNPALFIPLALRIGWGYLLMYFFLLLLLSAPAALVQLVGDFLPITLAAFLFSLGSNYYTIVSYHLMGYVILQYHEQIGYKIEFQDFRETEGAKETPRDMNTGVLGRVNFLLKEGKHNEAHALLREEEQKNGLPNPELSECYFKLLLMKSDAEALEVHGKKHLNLLVQKNEKEKACETFLKCVEAVSGFLPEPAVLLKVGGWLNASGKHREAIGAYNRLIKSFPDSPLVPKTLFQAAKVYNDRLMNPDKAARILKATMQKYPDHEFIPHIQNYLSQMNAG